MTIEWFPGHMATARREAAATMRNTDVVIEVLDARVPLSSLNPMVEQLRRENHRPALLLLNKADIADPKRTAAWLAHYNAQDKTRAVALSASKAGEVARIPAACLELAPSRGTATKPLRMMILGIPNVGKSTLMNTLLKRHIANVGDEPAVTKMQAKHELGPGMWIIDTPGMMWPKLDQVVALKLAATHSIGRNAYDEENAALDLARYLLRDYPANLEARYGVLPHACEPHQLLVHIAAARSIVTSDATTKAAIVLLNDFRMAKLGRITLDVPVGPKA
jgi:ribosome biogenesis GTPase A